MKIIITGGHFSPALAIIQKIGHENDIVVVGRRYAFEGDRNETFEYRLCQDLKIPFVILNAGRLQRAFTKHTIPSMLRFPKGLWQAFRVLQSEKPDVVVTFGGYIGLPVAYAAKLLGIPVVLHEQTQRGGLSARIISRIASVVCISFPTSSNYFPKTNVVLTGNPLREGMFESQKVPFQYTKPMIYITGGSAGSHAINAAMYEILPDLLKDFTVVHQTGNSLEFNDFERLTEYKSTLNPNLAKQYIISEFFKPKEAIAFMQNSILVVSRSGINTVLELMAVGRMSILIPLPYGQRNEQKDNAILFEKTGLGKMLLQKEMTGQSLLALIHAMIERRSIYEENAEKAFGYVQRDAAQRIIEQIYKYGRRESKDVTEKEQASITVQKEKKI